MDMEIVDWSSETVKEFIEIEYIALAVDCTICVFSDIFVQTNPRGVVPSLVQT